MFGVDLFTFQLKLLKLSNPLWSFIVFYIFCEARDQNSLALKRFS